ncbi:MAG: hypothetical protein CMJ83_17710 [Planctomycetes bacterium]|nr:hypothetical protein [Planctomycetota bacterium]
MKGPGGIGDLQAAKNKSRQFGDLPPKLRERILQSKDRGFPKGYDRVLTEYYKRLARKEAKKESDAKGSGK